MTSLPYETEKELLYVANLLTLKNLFEFASLAKEMPNRFGTAFQPSMIQFDANIVNFCGFVGKMYETLHAAYELDPCTPLVTAYVNSIIIPAQINGGNSISKQEQLNCLHQIACRMIGTYAIEWTSINSHPGYERWVETLERFHFTLTVIFLAEEISRVVTISERHLNARLNPNDVTSTKPSFDQTFLIRSLAKLQRFFEVFVHLSSIGDSVTSSSDSSSINIQLPAAKLYDPITLLTMLDTLDDATFEHISDFSQRIAPIVMATVASGVNNPNGHHTSNADMNNPLSGFSSFLSNSPVLGLVGSMLSNSK